MGWPSRFVSVLSWSPGGGAEPQPWIESDFVEYSPSFSPDGRWLAYWSEESGRGEVYVMPFPGPGRRVQVSTDSGGWMQWRADGRFEVLGVGCGDDGNPCTSDSCNGAGACVHLALADDTPCDDGNGCTADEDCTLDPQPDLCLIIFGSCLTGGTFCETNADCPLTHHCDEASAGGDSSFQGGCGCR